MTPVLAMGLKGNAVDTLLEIGKQVPALAVLAGVVIVGLKALSALVSQFFATIKEMQTANSTATKELQTTYLLSLRDIQTENTDSRSQQRIAMQENTTATREMTRTLVELLAVSKNKT